MSSITKHSMSDAEILKNSESYPWMFGMLLDRYQKAFMRRGLQILRSQESAEDAVQETFIRIYKYAHKFEEKEGASFKSWAYKILVNTCYTHAVRQSSKIEHVRTVDFADLDTIGGAEFLEQKEKSSFVESVLVRLPHKLSRLLRLHLFEEKSYEEIALAENLSLSAVRSGLHRARKQFKDIAFKMTC